MSKKENYCGQLECPITGFCKRYEAEARGLARLDGLFANNWCDDFKGDEDATKRAKTYIECLPKDTDAKKSTDALIQEKSEQIKADQKEQREGAKKDKKRKIIKDANPKAGNMEDRIVPIDLTMDELIAKGQVAGDLNRKVVEAEANKKSFNEKINSEIKIMKGQLQDVLKEIEDKQELRNVECSISYDLDNNKVVYFNNGKRVDERDLTEDDHQQELPV